MGNMDSRHLAEQEVVLNNGPTKAKKSKPKYSKLAMSDFYAIARELGFVSVRPQEKQLIELLRWTSYHGRNVVVDVAVAMRRSHPWVDCSPDNTKTTYPDDGRFFCPRED